jgi:hypothetical protein
MGSLATGQTSGRECLPPFPTVLGPGQPFQRTGRDSASLCSSPPQTLAKHQVGALTFFYGLLRNNHVSAAKNRANKGRKRKSPTNQITGSGSLQKHTCCSLTETEYASPGAGPWMPGCCCPDAAPGAVEQRDQSSRGSTWAPEMHNTQWGPQLCRTKEQLQN